MSNDGLRRRSMPRVIFVGPPKTGTTWIYDYLTELESVVLPRGTKETFFFDRYYERGLSFYETFFPEDLFAVGKVPVEVAPSYCNSSVTLERIARDLPSVTAVISIRDPVERTISLYKHQVRYGYYRDGLADHVRPHDDVFLGSDYPRLLSTALNAFGADRVKVLDFRELISQTELFCARVCSCVGVNYQAPSAKLLSGPRNQSRVPRSRVLARTATRISALFQRYGLHAVSHWARETGLRSLLERPARPEDAQVSEELRAQIREVLGFSYDEFLLFASPYVPAPADGFPYSDGISGSSGYTV